MKKFLSLVFVFVLVTTLFAACGSSTKEHTFVELTLDQGAVVIGLYPEYAPNTGEHFIETVKSGYYEGKVFHRADYGFVQGGSKDGFGVGGRGKTVVGEFTENGHENTLKHERGVVSMARTQDPNSADAQFFIMTQAVTNFDGRYATFGKVVEGLDIIDWINALPRRGMSLDEIIAKPVIRSAKVLKNYVPESEKTE